jgi:ribosome-binding protein aMBF1 (putative translation factor)
VSYRAKKSDMRTLESVLRERLDKYPDLAADLDEARADVAVAIQIAFAREHRQLTQRQLAERANFKVSAIGRLEQGTISPTVQTIRRIARALNARFMIESNGDVKMETVDATPIE